MQLLTWHAVSHPKALTRMRVTSRLSLYQLSLDAMRAIAILDAMAILEGARKNDVSAVVDRMEGTVENPSLGWQVGNLIRPGPVSLSEPEVHCRVVSQELPSWVMRSGFGCDHVSAAVRASIGAYQEECLAHIPELLADRSLDSATGKPTASGTYQLGLPVLEVLNDDLGDLPGYARADVLAAHLAYISDYLGGSGDPPDQRSALSSLLSISIPAVPGQLCVIFPSSDPRELVLLDVLLADDAPAAQALPAASARPVVEYCRQALSLMARVAPGLAAGFATLMAAVIVASAGKRAAGSSSNCISAMHLSPRAKWPVAKYAELLLHEFVHQALYLDECVHGMFAQPDRTAKYESLVLSAVRHVPRPYELAFHGACVAFVQSRFYARLGIADPLHLEPVESVLPGLREHRDRLSEHGMLRLAELADLCSQFPTDG